MMAASSTLTVTLRADVREAIEALETLKAALAEVTYAAATADASMTRLSRAMWPYLPFWKRVWLTLRRKGW